MLQARISDDRDRRGGGGRPLAQNWRTSGAPPPPDGKPLFGPGSKRSSLIENVSAASPTTVRFPASTVGGGRTSPPSECGYESNSDDDEQAIADALLGRTPARPPLKASTSREEGEVSEEEHAGASAESVGLRGPEKRKAPHSSASLLERLGETNELLKKGMSDDDSLAQYASRLDPHPKPPLHERLSPPPPRAPRADRERPDRTLRPHNQHALEPYPSRDRRPERPLPAISPPMRAGAPIQFPPLRPPPSNQDADEARRATAATYAGGRKAKAEDDARRVLAHRAGLPFSTQGSLQDRLHSPSSGRGASSGQYGSMLSAPPSLHESVGDPNAALLLRMGFRPGDSPSSASMVLPSLFGQCGLAARLTSPSAMTIGTTPLQTRLASPPRVEGKSLLERTGAPPTGPRAMRRPELQDDVPYLRKSTSRSASRSPEPPVIPSRGDTKPRSRDDVRSRRSQSPSPRRSKSPPRRPRSPPPPRRLSERLGRPRSPPRRGRSSILIKRSPSPPRRPETLAKALNSIPRRPEALALAMQVSRSGSPSAPASAGSSTTTVPAEVATPSNSDVALTPPLPPRVSILVRGLPRALDLSPEEVFVYTHHGCSSATAAATSLSLARLPGGRITGELTFDKIEDARAFAKVAPSQWKEGWAKPGETTSKIEYTVVDRDKALWPPNRQTIVNAGRISAGPNQPSSISAPSQETTEMSDLDGLPLSSASISLPGPRISLGSHSIGQPIQSNQVISLPASDEPSPPTRPVSESKSVLLSSLSNSVSLSRLQSHFMSSTRPRDFRRFSPSALHFGQLVEGGSTHCLGCLLEFGSPEEAEQFLTVVLKRQTIAGMQAWRVDDGKAIFEGVPITVQGSPSTLHVFHTPTSSSLSSGPAFPSTGEPVSVVKQLSMAAPACTPSEPTSTTSDALTGTASAQILAALPAPQTAAAEKALANGAQRALELRQRLLARKAAMGPAGMGNP